MICSVSSSSTARVPLPPPSMPAKYFIAYSVEKVMRQCGGERTRYSSIPTLRHCLNVTLPPRDAKHNTNGKEHNDKAATAKRYQRQNDACHRQKPRDYARICYNLNR